jgi:hypothetical protein
MFLVYNERTGDIVARLRDMVRASQVALDYTEQHSWVSGDKFDVRVA